MDLANFWSSPLSTQLKHPEPVRQLLAALEDKPAVLYDLLFYSSFAEKMLTVMRREGKDTQGFSRMQQSFSEAVQRVRAAIDESAAHGFSRAASYTEMSQSGMSRLLEMIGDLTHVKNWQVHEEGISENDDTTNDRGLPGV